MSVKLHNLMKEEREVAFEYEDEKVTIRYRPAAITPQMQSVASRMQAMGIKADEAREKAKAAKAKGEDNAAEPADLAATLEMGSLMTDFCGVIVTLVASWDIVADDGKPLPVTDALCMRMPLNFLMAIFRAAMDDMRPNEGNVGT